jgi:hypothetical protein
VLRELADDIMATSLAAVRRLSALEEYGLFAFDSRLVHWQSHSAHWEQIIHLIPSWEGYGFRFSLVHDRI